MEGRRGGKSGETKLLEGFNLLLWNRNCKVDSVPNEAYMKKGLRRDKVTFRVIYDKTK